MAEYSKKFYQACREGSLRSAKKVVPLLIDFLHPQSVVDVGCGVGTWLSVFKETGVQDVLGIDRGDVDRTALEIPESQFLAHDLTGILRLERRFDLVICLEVAEHLPTATAETLVEGLTNLGPCVLFSAGIPFQGGTHHVNEQWPEYWARLFSDKGFVALDVLRKVIWEDEQVEWWYSQNMLLYVTRDSPCFRQSLKMCAGATHGSQLSIVHPRNYLSKADLKSVSPFRLILALPLSVAYSLKRALGRTSNGNGRT
jgi:SAM-dependent methyltransferase